MMEPSTNRDSAPTLEVGAIGVVDSRGHFVEHAAMAPQKPRTSQKEIDEPAIIVRTERAVTSPESSHDAMGTFVSLSATTVETFGDTKHQLGTQKPNFEEITAARKAPRRANGMVTLDVSSAIDTNRFTLVVFLIGIVLLLLAYRLYVR